MFVFDGEAAAAAGFILAHCNKIEFNGTSHRKDYRLSCDFTNMRLQLNAQTVLLNGIQNDCESNVRQDKWIHEFHIGRCRKAKSERPNKI